MVSRYVLSQCFSGRAYSPTYWAVKTVAGNMLGFNVERNGMPIPSSVATISTSISTAAPNAGQWIHFLFQFSFKSSLTWRKILFFHSICIKASKIQTQFIMCHIYAFSGLWCRYLCTLSAFLVEQHFLQISHMVPISKCLDSMCWMTLCLILLINPHSRQSQSPVRDLCIFRPTRHSRTRSWFKPLSPKTWQS